MPFAAHVVQVLIASPGDVTEDRQALREAIWAWNDEHAAALGVVLLPVGWETHSRPELGEHPQLLIDRQLAERADALLGVFWTRLGTPTPDAASGTVHEVESFARDGKPVLLYFSDRPVVPGTVELDQLSAVRDFRRAAEGWGLIGRYDDIPSLVRQAGTALLRLVRDQFDLPTAIGPVRGGVDPPRVLANVVSETQPNGSGFRGQTVYRTDTYLELVNVGGSAARAVTLTWVEGQEGPSIHDAHAIDHLPKDARVRFALLTYDTSPSDGTLHLTWQDDDGKPYEEWQTLRF